MSRFTPFPVSLMVSPVKLPPLDVDILYHNLNRCLAYLYPVLDAVASFSDLLHWKTYWKSFLCLFAMAVMSLRTDLLPLFFHGMLLHHLLWSKVSKTMRSESHVRNLVLHGDDCATGVRGEDLQVCVASASKKGDDGGDSKDDNGEAKLGATVSALMLLCPGWLKETLRQAQASLGATADGLDMVHGMLTWKDDNVTWGVVGATVLSGLLFYAVHISTWLQFLGVAFLLSGTSGFQLVIMLLAGTAGEISEKLLQGPSIDQWLCDD